LTKRKEKKMIYSPTRVRAIALGKTNKEMRRRGYKVATAEFTRFTLGKLHTKKCMRVMEETDRILSEWEGMRGGEK